VKPALVLGGLPEPEGRNDWIDAELHALTGSAAYWRSRSQARRIAAQRGEPAPNFAPEPPHALDEADRP